MTIDTFNHIAILTALFFIFLYQIWVRDNILCRSQLTIKSWLYLQVRCSLFLPINKTLNITQQRREEYEGLFKPSSQQGAKRHSVAFLLLFLRQVTLLPAVNCFNGKSDCYVVCHYFHTHRAEVCLSSEIALPLPVMVSLEMGWWFSSQLGSQEVITLSLWAAGQ